MNDELRGIAFDSQCDVCGYDIEMQSFVLVNEDDLIDELICMSCYKEIKNEKENY